MDLRTVEQRARRGREAAAAAALATIDASVGSAEASYLAFLRFASDYLKATTLLMWPTGPGDGYDEEERQTLMDQDAAAASSSSGQQRGPRPT